jgi:outer membrane lipoprotein-sorting protein
MRSNGTDVTPTKRSASSSWRRRLTAAAAALLSTPPLPAGAQRAVPAWSLPVLMATMHDVRSSKARFVETKYFRLLNQAQQSSGQLIYVAPNYMQKATAEPRQARLTINGDRLTIEQQGERTREISLQDYSEIGPLVESVRATLAGDLSALTRYFATTLEGGADNWTLTLTPREPRLRELVATIRIQGERNAVRDVQTLEADGDRTDMVVLPDPK